ncbi:MAG: hypothetical protein M1840_001184 [Geoglossum simile]|nr:MAG: hypothetical protein M1840_001184 [Geoglossum simile]
MATAQVMESGPCNRYRNGSFIVLSWEGDVSDQGDVNGLTTYFEKKLGFSVVKCPLRSAIYDPFSSILHELDGDHNLLVVYYRGPGRKHEDYLYLTSDNTAEHGEQREVRWSGIEDMLLNAAADVLMVLDCPFGHSRNAASHDDSLPAYEHSRHMELLTSWDIGLPESRWAGKTSLTKCLTWALDEMWTETRDGFISTSELWRRIRVAPSYSGAQLHPIHRSLFRRLTPIKLAQPQCFFDFTLPFRSDRHYKLLAGDESALVENSKLIYVDEWTEVYKSIWKCGVSDSSTHVRSGPSGAHVAIKRFRPKNIIQASDIQLIFERERSNLTVISTWKHCRILEFLGSFEVAGTEFGHFDLIFPYAEGGDLHSFLRLEQEPHWLIDYRARGNCTLTQAICKEITGLSEAVKFIHSKGNPKYAVHRDIKPSNIFIHENMFKLGDFGLSRIKDREESSKSEWLAGTRMYNPPERDYEEKHGRARDVWALGCVILELIVLLEHGFRKPSAVDVFQQDRLRSTEQKVRAFSQTMGCVNEWVQRLEENGSQVGPIGAMLRIVKKMLNLNPKTRYTAREVERDFQVEMFHIQTYGPGRITPETTPTRNL